MIRKNNTNKTNQLIVYSLGGGKHFFNIKAHTREQIDIDTSSRTTYLTIDD